LGVLMRLSSRSPSLVDGSTSTPILDNMLRACSTGIVTRARLARSVADPWTHTSLSCGIDW
jgi:hypothetical protein